MEKLIDKLRKIAIKAQFEQTYQVYLKNTVVVGENENGKILCVGFHRVYNSHYGEDHIALDVLYNFKQDNLYGMDCDFGSIQFMKNHNYTSVDVYDKPFPLYKHALELVLREIKNNGNKWVKEQQELQIKNRYYLRLGINAKGNLNISFTERKKMMEIKAKLNDLRWRVRKNFDAKILEEMNRLGEEKFTEVENAKNNIAMDVLNQIFKEEKK